MKTLYDERRLPGYSRPPYPVGPWTDFEPDSAWTDSRLRVRLIFGGRFGQFKGVISGEPLGESPARIGILEPAYRPGRPLGFVVGGRRSGWPNLTILADGSVILLEPPIAPNFSIHVVYPLD